MKKLEKAFEAEIIENAKRAEIECGCSQTRLLKLITEIGGVNTVKSFIAKKQSSQGQEQLKKCGHLELSVEASVTSGKYSQLFTDEEVDFCLEQLLELGYFGV